MSKLFRYEVYNEDTGEPLACGFPHHDSQQIARQYSEQKKNTIIIVYRVHGNWLIDTKRRYVKCIRFMNGLPILSAPRGFTIPQATGDNS